MPDTIDIIRHESVFDPSKYNYPMHIIGAGATGSRVFAALVELGMTNIKVYDPDRIESHNLANQIYNTDDVGEYKVTGCKKFYQRKVGTLTVPEEMLFLPEKVTAGFLLRNNIYGGVVFILTDTMASRQAIFNGLTRRTEDSVNSIGEGGDPALRRPPLLIIETRMGSTHGSIFTVNPFDKAACDAWHKTLVDDTNEDNIELSPCGTTLSVGTTAALIANYAVWQMMQFFTDPLSVQPQLDFFFKPTLTISSPTIIPVEQATSAA